MSMPHITAKQKAHPEMKKEAPESRFRMMEWGLVQRAMINVATVTAIKTADMKRSHEPKFCIWDVVMIFFDLECGAKIIKI